MQQHRSLLVLSSLLGVACGSSLPGGGGGPVESDDPSPVVGATFGVPPEPSARAPREARIEPTTYLIHVGGLCSTSFAGSEGGSRLADIDGVVSVDAAVDETESMAVAVPEMRDVLDAYCTGEDLCEIYTHSNGGAVVSKTLSVYDASRWNVLWVLSAASNEGGSELSGSFVADLGDVLGIECNLSNNVAPSDHRAAWNHDDTGGSTIYLAAGKDEWWYTGSFPDFFSGMANDGAVAFHSSAGLNDTYFVSDDDPWLCYEPRYHWANHEVAYTCEGFDLDHHAMKAKGIAELGG